LLIGKGQSTTLGWTTRQAGNIIDHNPTVESRSAQQQMARLIGNGLQYSRAATRVASDTPMGIATRAQTAQNTPSHIRQNMARLRGDGWSYSRAATRSVASDRIPVCMERPPTTGGEETKDVKLHMGKKGGGDLVAQCKRHVHKG
jgi:hypothetical protein